MQSCQMGMSSFISPFQPRQIFGDCLDIKGKQRHWVPSKISTNHANMAAVTYECVCDSYLTRTHLSIRVPSIATLDASVVATSNAPCAPVKAQPKVIVMLQQTIDCSESGGNGSSSRSRRRFSCPDRAAGASAGQLAGLLLDDRQAGYADPLICSGRPEQWQIMGSAR